MFLSRPFAVRIFAAYRQLCPPPKTSPNLVLSFMWIQVSVSQGCSSWFGATTFSQIISRNLRTWLGVFTSSVASLLPSAVDGYDPESIKVVSGW